jgi:hypothetical protein
VNLAIQVFEVIIENLCCSLFQLDMDRMDYLKRDSFIQVLLVNSTLIKWWMCDDVWSSKKRNIFSREIPNVQRLMYWQAYLHKTSLVAGNFDQNIKTCQRLTLKELFCRVATTLQFFAKQNYAHNIRWDFGCFLN